MERKYRMTRMPIGDDWVFLANDGATICRVGSYEEDGSAIDGDDRPITGRFWMSFIFNGTQAEADSLVERDIEEFCYRWAERPYGGGQWWRDVGSMHRTRREAIDYALVVADRVAAVRER